MQRSVLETLGSQRTPKRLQTVPETSLLSSTSPTRAGSRYGEVFKAMVNGQFMAVKKIRVDAIAESPALEAEARGGEDPRIGAFIS